MPFPPLLPLLLCRKQLGRETELVGASEPPLQQCESSREGLNAGFGALGSTWARESQLESFRPVAFFKNFTNFLFPREFY